MRTKISMPRVGLEPTIPGFELAKTVHALDRAAIVIAMTRLFSLSLSLSLWLYSSSDFGRFLNLYTVGRTPWRVARPLPTHRTTQTQNKCTQTSKPRVGLEPTIPAFEQTNSRIYVCLRGGCVMTPSVFTLHSVE
jgi:hypothetical protein